MKKSILLVDDEDIFHFINSKIIALTGIACDIQTASNGEEALYILNTYFTGTVQIPDIIFLDLDMPTMDGFEFISAFNNIDYPHKHKISIVVLTSSMDPKDKAKASKMGIKHFISKPLSEEDLRSILA